MADFFRRVVVPKTRVEYALTSPTNWAEVEKVLTAIANATDKYRFSEYDDFVRVEIVDDEIVFSYEEEE